VTRWSGGLCGLVIVAKVGGSPCSGGSITAL
jgi:hypothetical protein